MNSTQPHRQPKLLLFDIDGTLILSGGAGGAALNRACEELLGIRNAMAAVNPGGMTDGAIVRRIITSFLARSPEPGEIECILRRYLAHLPHTLGASTRFHLLPGFPELLDTLRERPDILLGLGTGNLSEGARIKLEFAGLFHYFRFGGFGSDAEDRAELLRRGIERGKALSRQPVAPEHIFVIGDTALDVESGRRAGVRTVAVATGSTSRQELARHRPDYLFDSFADAKPFLALMV